MAEVLGKHQIEKALHDERRDIKDGRLKEENPLDTSTDFRVFCEASRRGDLKTCQEQITKGVNINARDEFDYTPLILASLCGHFEVVQMLLENGALCERDTFQGERCLYNALNDRIRNLLLQYDYSKSTDPLQPLAAHVTSLLVRDTPKTADIAVHTADATFELHKFVLSARSPYFQKKLATSPETKSWRMSSAVPTESFRICIRYLYLGDAMFVAAEEQEEQESILSGIDKLSRQLEIPQLFEAILQSGDRRQARQRRTEEVERGRNQLASWFEDNVLRNRLEVPEEKADDIKWDRDNGIFADVLLKADEDDEVSDEDEAVDIHQPQERTASGIPIGHFQQPTSRTASQTRKTTTLFPAHRAMLLRSEVFATMFASPFREAQPSPTLPIIPVDCSPAVLEILLRFLYTERADFPLSLALDVLHAADMLFLEKLKQRAALLISTLGNGRASVVEAENPRGETATAEGFEGEEEEAINVYDVVRSAWTTRVHRLEEFGARYIAQRLERYIDALEFRDLVQESAGRIQGRQETDTVELVDDIRYYLSERFRLRFEDAGLDEMMDESGDGGVGMSEEEQVAVLEGRARGGKGVEDEGVDVHSGLTPPHGGEGQVEGEEGFAPDVDFLESQQGVVRTLDGEEAGDEFAQDAMNYQILLGKLDRLMEELGLDG